MINRPFIKITILLVLVMISTIKAETPHGSFSVSELKVLVIKFKQLSSRHEIPFSAEPFESAQISVYAITDKVWKSDWFRDAGLENLVKGDQARFCYVDVAMPQVTLRYFFKVPEIEVSKMQLLSVHSLARPEWHLEWILGNHVPRFPISEAVHSVLLVASLSRVPMTTKRIGFTFDVPGARDFSIKRLSDGWWQIDGKETKLKASASGELLYEYEFKKTNVSTSKYLDKAPEDWTKVKVFRFGDGILEMTVDQQSDGLVVYAVTATKRHRINVKWHE